MAVISGGSTKERGVVLCCVVLCCVGEHCLQISIGYD
jgi:hypothetical protein